MQESTGYPSENLTALTIWWPLFFFHLGEPQSCVFASCFTDFKMKINFSCFLATWLAVKLKYSAFLTVGFIFVFYPSWIMEMSKQPR